MAKEKGVDVAKVIDEASHGRAYLGIARGAWLDFLGITPPHPVTALREAFDRLADWLEVHMGTQTLHHLIQQD